MNTNIIKKIGTSIITGIILSVPIITSADGIVPCGGGGAEPTCDFNQLMIMVNRIIHFLFYDVAIPLTTIIFMYVGARLVLYQDKMGEWKKAKEAFANIGIGFGMMVGAFVLIKFILSQVLDTSNGFSVDFLLK